MAAYIGVIQMPQSWHHQGMFMGLHWAWWLFWIAAAAIVIWAFVRLAADYLAAKREARRCLAVEDALRRRHALGDIDDQQLAHELMDLIRVGPDQRE